MVVRVDHMGNPFEISEQGSSYIDHLLQKLKVEIPDDVNWSKDLIGLEKRDLTIPMLTVRHVEKWYGLVLVSVSGNLIPVKFDELEAYCPKSESPFRDHVPNPVAVINMVNANKWQISVLAMELIIGRWELEYNERYAHRLNGV